MAGVARRLAAREAKRSPKTALLFRGDRRRFLAIDLRWPSPPDHLTSPGQTLTASLQARQSIISPAVSFSVCICSPQNGQVVQCIAMVSFRHEHADELAYPLRETPAPTLHLSFLQRLFQLTVRRLPCSESSEQCVLTPYDGNPITREGCHAHLFDRGIPWNQKTGKRVEALCLAETMRFAKRVAPERLDWQECLKRELHKFA